MLFRSRLSLEIICSFGDGFVNVNVLQEVYLWNHGRGSIARD